MIDQQFEIPAQAYDAMVDWPRRLSAETPFFRGLFDEVKAKDVLDAACGTGRHAAMFASWGMRVEGADLSPAMIALAREMHGESESLTWRTRSFTSPPDRQFDVVICGGNSLPLVQDRAQLAQAIRAMAGAVRESGALVLHALNLRNRPEGAVTWDKCKRVTLDDRAHLLIKGTHRAGEYGYVEFVLTDLSGETPLMHTTSSRFLSLSTAELVESCSQSGLASVALFGGYKQQPFEPNLSTDMVVVARRQRPHP